MPIHRYGCESCGAEFKVLQARSEAAQAVCPECQITTRRRLLPRIGIVYNGSGFYSTDYRSKASSESSVSCGSSDSTEK